MSQNTSYGLNGSRIPSMHFGGAKSATKTSSMSLTSMQSSTSSLYRGGPSFGGTFIAGGGGGRDESSYRNDMSYSASSHRQKSTGGLFNKRPGYYSSSAKKSSNGSLGLFSTTPRPNRSNLQLSSSSAKYANSTGRRNTMTSLVTQDPRNTQDTAFQQSVYKKIVSFLTSHEFPEHLSTNFMRFPNKHTMIKIFRFLFEFLQHGDPSILCIDTQFEHVIPELMAKLGYPPKVNKSSLQSFTGVRNLAILHGILDYLVNTILYKENLCPEDFLPNADNDREALAKARFLVDDIFDNDLDDDPMVTRMGTYLGQKFHGFDENEELELESQEDQLEARLLELNEKILACGEVFQELNALTERLAESETLEAKMAPEPDELESSYNHPLQDMAALTRREDFLLKEIEEIETIIANQRIDRGRQEAVLQRKKHLVGEIEREETQIQQLKQEETSILNSTKSDEYELSKLACDLVSYVNSIRLTYARSASKGDSERVSKDLASPEWERVVEALSMTASGEIKLDVSTLEKFNSLMIKNRELIAESFSDVQGEMNSLKKKHDFLIEKRALTIESKAEEEYKNLENDEQEFEELKLRSEEELKKLSKKVAEFKEDYQILSQTEESFEITEKLCTLQSRLENEKNSDEEEEHQWVVDLQANHEREKSELECLHKALKRFNEMLSKDTEVRKVHLKVEKYLAAGVRKWLDKEKKKKTSKTDDGDVQISSQDVHQNVFQERTKQPGDENVNNENTILTNVTNTMAFTMNPMNGATFITGENVTVFNAEDSVDLRVKDKMDEMIGLIEKMDTDMPSMIQ